jgi:uncharacterized repeat protein (TIGR01451 family)
MVILMVEARPATSQSFDHTSWATDGSVRAYAVSGSKVYLGGVFTRVGLAMGSGVPLERATGLPVQDFPRVNSTFWNIVYVAVSDGAGGWYIGGDFTTVGGLPRQNIARILADNTVSTWNPGANAPVRSITVSGGTVYVGGNFTSIGGQSRNHIAAVSATTGAATNWNPNANSAVESIVVNGTTIYVGGAFSNVGGQPRNNIAALSATTGLASTWNPNANGTVESIVVSGTTVFACGSYSMIGGQIRNNFAAVSASTGAATTFNPNLDGPVEAIHLVSSTFYVTGYFTTAAGLPRSHIAAITTAGTVTGWNPGVFGFGYSLASAGDTIFVGGDFETVGGQPRSCLAAISATSDATLGWDPSPNDAVYALANSGSRIFVGGFLTSLGGSNRRNAAAIDLITKTITPWDPSPPLFVNALAAVGDRVYAGGEFTFIGGQPRDFIAALDTTTGLALNWNPGGSGAVFDITVGDSVIYVGGDFSSIGGQLRDGLAALHPQSGTATSWNPGVPGQVRGIALRDGIAYIHGNFSDVGGQPRDGLAAVNLASGTATEWNPAPNGAVEVLEVGHDGTVFVGGDLTQVGGQPRNGLAALDDSLGSANPTWDPNHDGSQPNVSMALSTGGWTLYVGGEFSSIGGASNPRLAALNVSTGLSRPWSPITDPEVAVVGVSMAGVLVAGSVPSPGGFVTAHLAVVAAERVLQSVSPSHGGNSGTISVSVAGEELASAAALYLSGPGPSNPVGTALVASPDGTRLDAIFDLTNAAPGIWDLYMEAFDEQNASLLNAFTVEVPEAPLLRVSLLGPSLVRSNYPASYDIVVENAGNVDAVAVPLWFAGLPLSATVEPVFTVATVPSGGGEPDWSGAPLTLTGTEGQYLSLLLPRVPPGVTVRRVNVTTPGTVGSFELRAGVTPGWSEDVPALVACLASQGVTVALPCVGGELSTLSSYLSAHPELAAVNGVGAWAREAWRCEAAGSLPAAVADAEQVLDVLVAGIEQPAPLPGPCTEAAGPRWRTRLLVTVVGAVDPNEKLSDSTLVSLERRVPYTIRFENLGTAAAQRVTVVDTIDTSVLDVNTVQLGEISFGDRYVSPAPGDSRFATEVDLRPAKDLIVRVNAELDRVTGVLVWRLLTEDPATGLLLSPSILDGFLPPSSAPPHLQGQGSVFFSVKPRLDVAPGAIVQNRASLKFDNEAPILTAFWRSSMDNEVPASRVLPLAATQDSVNFTIRWEPVGTPTDLRDYTVYKKDDDGEFLPWRTSTTATAATFTAELGHRYWFYSVARDLGGNIESAPVTPDASTWATLAVGDPEPQLRLALEGALPNPARGVVNAWFTLPASGNAKLELIDVSGRRVARREVGALGPGRHTIALGRETRISAGLYWLRLTRAGETRVARVVVMR